ncbi:MAG: segregation/condensation protein A, partial [Patescibacteria group bacterium]
MYQLALEKFSGPLDMLLNLVEDQKLSINEISLASVAEQYISYLKSVENLSKEELSSFLIIAATLILIKSRSLIPQMQLTEDENIDIQELEHRLRTYKFFKDLAIKLTSLQKEHHHLFGREAYLGMTTLFIPSENININNLVKIIKEVLATIPTKELLPTDTIGRAV